MFEKIFFLTKGEYMLEGQVHIGYGIACRMEGEEIVFEDLSVLCRSVSNFVEKCNKLQLSPMHLRDAVEDFLMDCS